MDQLGRFLLVERAGEGEPSEYLARRILARGTVSPPVRLVHWARDPERALDDAVGRADRAARLEHPGVLRVLEVGTVGDRDYEAFEYVHGVRLADLIRDRRAARKPMSFSACLACAIQLLEIVDAVHAQGEVLGPFDPATIYWSVSGRVSLRLSDEVDPKYRPHDQTPAGDNYRVGRVLRVLLTTDLKARGRARVASGFSKAMSPILRGLNPKEEGDAIEASAAHIALCDVLENYKNRSARSCIASMVAQAAPTIPNGLSASDLGRIKPRGESGRVVYPQRPEAFTDRTDPVDDHTDSGVFQSAASDTDVRAHPDISADETKISRSGRIAARTAQNRAEASMDSDEMSDSGAMVASPGPAPGEAPTHVFDHDDEVDSDSPDFDPGEVDEVFESSGRVPVPPPSDPAEDKTHALDPLEGHALVDSVEEDSRRVFALEEASETDVPAQKTPRRISGDDDLSETDAPPEDARAPVAIADDDDEGPTATVVFEDEKKPGRSDEIAAHPTLPRVAEIEDESESETSASIPDRAKLSSLASELGPGTLLIDAPKDAVVFVDGRELGRGRVVIDDANRYQSYSVRVHRRGYAPWTEQVSLEGESSRKVSPKMKPR